MSDNFEESVSQDTLSQDNPDPNCQILKDLSPFHFKRRRLRKNSESLNSVVQYERALKAKLHRKQKRLGALKNRKKAISDEIKSDNSNLCSPQMSSISGEGEGFHLLPNDIIGRRALNHSLPGFYSSRLGGLRAVECGLREIEGKVDFGVMSPVSFQESDESRLVDIKEIFGHLVKFSSEEREKGDGEKEKEGN